MASAQFEPQFETPGYKSCVPTIWSKGYTVCMCVNILFIHIRIYINTHTHRRLPVEGGVARRAHLFPWRRGWRGAVHSSEPQESFTAEPVKREDQNRRCPPAWQPASVVSSFNRGPLAHIIQRTSCIERRGPSDERTQARRNGGSAENPLFPYRRVRSELCRPTSEFGPLTTRGVCRGSITAIPVVGSRASSSSRAERSRTVQGSPSHL